MNALVRLDILAFNETKKTPFDRFWRHKNKANLLLLDAVTNGFNDIVKKLINPLNPVDETAEVRYCNKQGHGAVHLAIVNSKATILKRLIEFDRTLLHMLTEDDLTETPLHLAVKKRDQAIVKVLLNEFNAPVVVKDARGSTPMHAAV